MAGTCLQLLPSGKHWKPKQKNTTTLSLANKKLNGKANTDLSLSIALTDVEY